jgi:hypothetical protein
VLVTTVIVPVGVSVGVTLSVKTRVMVPVAVLVAVRVPVGVSLTVPETVGVTMGVAIMVPPGVVIPFDVTPPADTELDVSVPGPNGAAGAEVPPQERLMNKQGARTRTAIKITCNEDLLTALLS